MQLAQPHETSIETTVEYDMASRSLSRVYEILEAADALVDIGDPNENEIKLTRRVVEDLTHVIHELAAKHSATMVPSDGIPSGMHCDACNSAWPCQVYRDIHRSLHDDGRCFETVRVTVFERSSR